MKSPPGAEGQEDEQRRPGHAVSAEHQQQGGQHRRGEDHRKDLHAAQGLLPHLGEGHHHQVVEELLVAETVPPRAQLGPGKGPRQTSLGHGLGESGVEVAVPLEEAAGGEGGPGEEPQPWRERNCSPSQKARTPSSFSLIHQPEMSAAPSHLWASITAGAVPAALAPAGADTRDAVGECA